MEATLSTSPATRTRRTLVIADWKTDPDAVIAACASRPEAQHAAVDLLVPATLHGIDWVGDPYANVPCARRAVDGLAELLQLAGIEVVNAAVGDHDPVAAAIDATLSQPVGQIIVCGPERRIKLFDLAHRVGRATGVPVLSLSVPPADRRGRGWARLRRGECGMTQRAARPSRPATA